MNRWLVDGMNVIGSRPDGWWRNRQKAVATFVDVLDSWARATGEPVTVVFDGERPPQLSDEDRVVDVVFVGRGRTADDEIARRVAADPDPESLLVVTSDGELVQRVTAHGARVLGAGTFRRRLDSVAH
jgi:predicted RNA-binding protein with PIN domain